MKLCPCGIWWPPLFLLLLLHLLLLLLFHSLGVTLSYETLHIHMMPVLMDLCGRASLTRRRPVMPTNVRTVVRATDCECALESGG